MGSNPTPRIVYKIYEQRFPCICAGAYVPKRTTVVIQDDTYAKLVQQSIQRFGNARAISRVIDARRKRPKKNLPRFFMRRRWERSQKELEDDRHELSLEFENRGL